ncbi:hypothetical protein ACLB2K_006075 [Fragaria x ananassa]
MGGCDGNGNLHEEKFSAPMPWIGMYIAAASFACLIAMAADVVLGFRYHKLWFPSKFFSINATTLTLLGVAIKLSVDLNTPMPNSHDQLAKLSSSVFICTAMSNSMPSLGAMENEEMFMNVIALGILVITLIFNICIQLATGAIFVFWNEHVAIMFIMFVQLTMLIFSSIAVPTTKNYLEKQYNKRHQLALKEGANQIMEAEKLREALTKHWFCRGESDYKLTTTLILFTQAVAVGVGTIAPAFRWFMAINFKCPKRGSISVKKEFEIEKYWIQGLLGLKKQPLTLRIKSRRYRKLAYEARNMLVDICIAMQKGIVLVSKAIRFISILFVSRIYLCCDIFKEWKIKKFDCNIGPQSEQNRRADFSCYVLFLEGEKALVEFMMRTNCNATEYWLQKGRKEEPENLLKLLQKSTFSQSFKGLAEFDSDQVPSLDSEEPPNCWALPVVTLTSIALALSSNNSCSIEMLVDGLNQGLMYINAIDDHLDHKSDFTNTRKAANIVWLQVDLYHTWLDVDLKNLSLLGKSPREVLKELAETAKSRFEESKRKRRDKFGCVMDVSPSKWSVKELASNSMHRICQTLLLNQTCDDRLFEALVVMISDIVGACLTNSQKVIAMKCFNSKIEEREATVRHAVHTLGKTERILEIVNKGIPQDLDPQQMGCIDEWRLSHKRKMIPSAFCFSSDSECDGSPLLVKVISPQHKCGV